MTNAPLETLADKLSSDPTANGGTLLSEPMVPADAVDDTPKIKPWAAPKAPPVSVPSSVDVAAKRSADALAKKKADAAASLVKQRSALAPAVDYAISLDQTRQQILSDETVLPGSVVLPHHRALAKQLGVPLHYVIENPSAAAAVASSAANRRAWEYADAPASLDVLAKLELAGKPVADITKFVELEHAVGRLGADLLTRTQRETADEVARTRGENAAAEVMADFRRENIFKRLEAEQFAFGSDPYTDRRHREGLSGIAASFDYGLQKSFNHLGSMGYIYGLRAVDTLLGASQEQKDAATKDLLADYASRLEYIDGLGRSLSQNRVAWSAGRLEANGASGLEIVGEIASGAWNDKIGMLAYLAEIATPVLAASAVTGGLASATAASLPALASRAMLAKVAFGAINTGLGTFIQGFEGETSGKALDAAKAGKLTKLSQLNDILGYAALKSGADATVNAALYSGAAMLASTIPAMRPLGWRAYMAAPLSVTARELAKPASAWGIDLLVGQAAAGALGAWAGAASVGESASFTELAMEAMLEFLTAPSDMVTGSFGAAKWQHHVQRTLDQAANLRQSLTAAASIHGAGFDEALVEEFNQALLGRKSSRDVSFWFKAGELTDVIEGTLGVSVDKFSPNVAAAINAAISDDSVVEVRLPDLLGGFAKFGKAGQESAIISITRTAADALSPEEIASTSEKITEDMLKAADKILKSKEVGDKYRKDADELRKQISEGVKGLRLKDMEMERAITELTTGAYIVLAHRQGRSPLDLFNDNRINFEKRRFRNVEEVNYTAPWQVQTDEFNSINARHANSRFFPTWGQMPPRISGQNAGGVFFGASADVNNPGYFSTSIGVHVHYITDIGSRYVGVNAKTPSDMKTVQRDVSTALDERLSQFETSNYKLFVVLPNASKLNTAEANLALAAGSAEDLLLRDWILSETDKSRSWSRWSSEERAKYGIPFGLSQDNAWNTAADMDVLLAWFRSNAQVLIAISPRTKDLPTADLFHLCQMLSASYRTMLGIETFVQDLMELSTEGDAPAWATAVAADALVFMPQALTSHPKPDNPHWRSNMNFAAAQAMFPMFGTNMIERVTPGEGLRSGARGRSWTLPAFAQVSKYIFDHFEALNSKADRAAMPGSDPVAVVESAALAPTVLNLVAQSAARMASTYVGTAEFNRKAREAAERLYAVSNRLRDVLDVGGQGTAQWISAGADYLSRVYAAAADVVAEIKTVDRMMDGEILQDREAGRFEDELLSRYLPEIAEVPRSRRAEALLDSLLDNLRTVAEPNPRYGEDPAPETETAPVAYSYNVSLFPDIDLDEDATREQYTLPWYHSPHEYPEVLRKLLPLRQELFDAGIIPGPLDFGSVTGEQLYKGIALAIADGRLQPTETAPPTAREFPAGLPDNERVYRGYQAASAWLYDKTGRGLRALSYEAGWVRGRRGGQEPSFNYVVFGPLDVEAPVRQVLGVFARTQDELSGFNQEVSTRLPKKPERLVQRSLDGDLFLTAEDILGIEGSAAPSSEAWRDTAAGFLEQLPLFDLPPEGSTPAQRVDSLAGQMSENLLALWHRIPEDERMRDSVWYEGANLLARRFAARFGVSEAVAAAALAMHSPQKLWDYNVALAEINLAVLAKHRDAAWDTRMDDAAASLPPSLTTTYEEIKGRSLSQLLTVLSGLRYDAGAGPAAQARRNSYNTAAKQVGLWIQLFAQAGVDPGIDGNSYRSVRADGSLGDVQRGGLPWSTPQYAGDVAWLAMHSDFESLSGMLSGQYKVRSFFNNILHPWSARSITMDTHAVNAALGIPLSGSHYLISASFSPERVKGDPNSGIGGIGPIATLAYLKAVEQIRAETGLALLPRQLQSILWVAQRQVWGGTANASAAKNKDAVAETAVILQQFYRTPGADPAPYLAAYIKALGAKRPSAGDQALFATLAERRDNPRASRADVFNKVVGKYGKTGPAVVFGTDRVDFNTQVDEADAPVAPVLSRQLIETDFYLPSGDANPADVSAAVRAALVDVLPDILNAAGTTGEILGSGIAWDLRGDDRNTVPRAINAITGLGSEVGTIAKGGTNFGVSAETANELKAAFHDALTLELERIKADAFDLNPGFDQTYAAEEPSAVVKASATFEVAPHPADAVAVGRWESLSPDQQQLVSRKLANQIVPKVLAHFGTSGSVIFHRGGWKGAGNPSMSVELTDPDMVAPVSKAIASVFSQEAVMGSANVPGAEMSPTGGISIKLQDTSDAAIDELYSRLWLGANLLGHTTIGDTMSSLNDEAESGISSEDLKQKVNEILKDDGITAEVTAGSVGFFTPDDTVLPAPMLISLRAEVSAGIASQPVLLSVRSEPQVEGLKPGEVAIEVTAEDEDGFHQIVESGWPVGGRPAEIEIDGVMRSTLSAGGTPLGKNPAEVKRFWKWFGNSKMVDSNGRPRVFYHGAPHPLFDDRFRRTEGLRGRFNGWRMVPYNVKSGAFFFSAHFGLATHFARGRSRRNNPTGGEFYDRGVVIPGMLRMENPLDLSGRNTVGEFLGGLQAAGLTDSDNRWVVGDYRGNKVTREQLDTLWSLLDDPKVVRVIRDAGFDGVLISEQNAANSAGFGGDEDAAISYAIFGANQFKHTDNVGTWKRSDDNFFNQETYTARNVYDLNVDPQGFDLLGDAAEAERQILAAGFSGYRRGNTVTMFRKGDVQKTVGGSFDPRTLTVSVTENMNASTLIHELGHAFLEIMAREVAAGRGSASMRADMATLLGKVGWAGTVQDWLSQPDNLRREAHETIAESFEMFFLMGEPPAAEMIGLFGRLRKFMLRAYGDIATFKQERYRSAAFDPEVAEVFNRLLATDAMIENSAAARQLMPLFETEEDFVAGGATHEDWIAYQKSLQTPELDQAKEELGRRSVRDMKWLRNRINKFLRLLRREAKAAYDEVRAQVASEVKDLGIYRALRFLKTGEGANFMGEAASPNQHRLSLEALKAMYGEGAAAPWRYLATGKHGVVTAQGGLHPDQVAPLFGFASGDELVRTLLESPPEEEAIEARTETIMFEKHADLNSPEAIQAAADALVANDAHLKMLATELVGLDKMSGKPSQILRAAKLQAAKMLATMPIKGLTPDATAAEAETMGRKSREAHLKGDRELAADYKRRQVLLKVLAREQRNLKETIGKQLKFAAKWMREDTRLEKRYDLDAIYAVRAIILRFSLLGEASDAAKAKVQTYLNRMQETGGLMFDNISAILASLPAEKPMRDLSTEDFSIIARAIWDLVQLSKLDRSIRLSGKIVSGKMAEEAIIRDVLALHGGVLPDMPGDSGTPTKLERAASSLLGLGALLRRVSAWASEFGPSALQFIHRPVVEAALRARQFEHTVFASYKDILTKYQHRMSRTPIHSAVLNMTFHGGKPEILHALLHTGTESNYRKLLIGNFGFTETTDDKGNPVLDDTKFQAFLREMDQKGIINAEDMAFVQEVWDLLDALKEPLQRAFHQMFGRYMTELESREVVTPWGTFTGRYVPAGIDKDAAPEIGQTLAMDPDALFERAQQGSIASVGLGLTRERTKVTKPLALDLRLISQHIAQVSRVIHLEPAIRDAIFLLKRPAVRDALNRHNPALISKLLIPWLDRTARQITQTPGMHTGLGRFYTALRERAGVVIMFGNIINTLQQVTGFSLALLRVSGRNLRRGMAEFLAGPGDLKRRVGEMSLFMYERMHNGAVENERAVHDLLLDPNAYQKMDLWFRRNGYFLQIAAQNIIDPIVWWAAFNDAVEKDGDVAKATYLADNAVRDTQNSYKPEDIAAFETATPFVRLFMQFMGYFNMQGNLIYSEMAKVFRSNGTRAEKTAAGAWVYFLGLAAPALVASLIASGAPDDEDGDGWLDDWLAWFFDAQVRNTAAMIPVAGAALTLGANMSDDRAYNDRLNVSPAVGLTEASFRGAFSFAGGKDGEYSAKEVRDILALVGVTTGVPTGQLGKTLGYVVDDKQVPEGAADVASGVMRGRQ